MSDEPEPGVPGADEPDAPGTEDEPTPPGMEEAEDTTEAPAATASAAAPQEGAVADGTTVATTAAPSADAATAYQYYDQQATAAYPGYGEQYAGYDQYYGYWPGYGDATAATGYDPYAGYYNQDGTTAYAYDPNTYTAPATSAAPAEAATTVPTATAAPAEGEAAATVVVPLPAAAANTPANATATASDAPVKPAPLSADQTAAAAQEIGAEHAANLLSVDEKQNLEQQQEAAETARKEAEERYQKAEEQRRNAKVKADEQAAKAAADYAQAQAEAQAELHRQLQQRLADAQAAAAAQEAEKEKRRVQPVTLKGARLAFNAPKAPGKPAATPPAGDQAGLRKPDMTIKLDPKPQDPPAKPEPKPEPHPPAKKPGQLYLPQPSTVKNAYLLMAQNKKSSGADKGNGPAPRQASPPRAPPSPARRPSPPRSPPRRPPSPDSDGDSNRQRSMQEAARRVKGRGNRRYRPEDGAMTGDSLPPRLAESGGDRRERDEHRSKHKHHRHHRRHRDREPDDMDHAPRQISPARFTRVADHAPARYVPPPYDQPSTEGSSANGGPPGQALFPGAFSSYNPAPSRGGLPMQQPHQQPHGVTQGYDRRNDRYAVPQQQSGMRAYPNASAASGQGASRHASGQAPAQQSIASGLPVLSDSSEDEEDLPLPGSTSMRAMSVLQKYLSGAPSDTPTAAAEAAAPQAASAAAVPRAHAVTTTASHIQHNSSQAAILAEPRARAQGRTLLNRGVPVRPLAAAPFGYGSDSDPRQIGAAAGDALRKKPAAAASLAAAAAGDGASDDMDMSPIVEHEKGDSLDSKALAKLPAQLREAAAAAMARHKAEQPKQAAERSIDTAGQASGRQAQHAKRGQRQYRQRGGDDELEGDAMPESALPNQAAGVAAATRMQEQEYEARARAKRARDPNAGEDAQEGSEDGRKRSKKHKKHHKKEKRDRSSRRDALSPVRSPAAPPQLHPQDRRFPQPPQDNFNRRTGYPPQQPRHQQQDQGQGLQQGFNRQPGYDQGHGLGQGQGFQRKPSFGQNQAVSGRPGQGPDLLQQQRYPQEGGAGPGIPPARRRRQFSDRRSPSRSRSRSRSFSRSRSRSYSRSRSRSRLRSRSPRRFNRSVTPPPRRGFGLRADQQGRADACRPGAAPVHGIPPPGSGPAPPAQPPQPYGLLPPVSAYPPSSGAFGHMAPNPLAGMFQPLPAAPPANPMLVNQQAAAEKAGKAAKRLYVGNIPFDTTQSELISFFDTIMTDTNAVAADTEEQGSAVTSCTLYDRSSAAAGPKAKYAFLNLRSVEETSNCVAFDGVYLKTNALKVRRPDDYDAKKVADLGPSEPSSSLNSLVLSQLRRPPPPPPEPEVPPAPAPAPALSPAALQGFAPAASGEVEDGEVGGAVAVTRVLKLEHMVARDELLDEEEYNDIVDDITEEIETKYGHIQNIAIPRPTSPEDQATSGVGFVFVEFADAAASVKAQKALHGRMFGENQIDASYYSEDAMAQKQYV